MSSIIVNRAIELAVENKRKISGMLSRYQVVNASTGVIAEDSEVNIKNTVVDSGLRLLCTLSDAHAGLFVNNSSSGVMQWCARGIGSAETTNGMTDLAERIGNYTNTVYFVSGEEYCGTKIYVDPAGVTKSTITLRITHRHEVESVERIITELGWYSRSSSPLSYTMFSRVLLPSPVTVPQGYYLQTTYDVEIEIPYVAETPLSSLGLQGINAPATARVCCRLPLDNLGFGTRWNDILASIRSNGTIQGVDRRSSLMIGATFSANVPFEVLNAAASSSPTASGNDASIEGHRYKSFLLHKLAGESFPALGNLSIANNTWYGAGIDYSSPGEQSISVNPYVEGSFERELQFVMGIGWPNNLAEVPLGLFIVNGVGYRLFNDEDPGAVPTKLSDQILTLIHVVGWARTA